MGSLPAADALLPSPGIYGYRKLRCLAKVDVVRGDLRELGYAKLKGMVR